MQNNKILLASYGGGHVNMIVPVYKSLLKAGFEPIVFGFTAAEVRLKNENISYISYKDFVNEYGNKEDILKYGQELHSKLGPNALISEDETIAYLGINFYELVQREGLESAQALYKKLERKSFLPLEFMTYVLKKFNPCAVVSTNSPRSEEAILKSAKLLNIKRYCINDFLSKMELEARTGHAGYANKIFVANEKFKTFFIQSGWDASDVIVSGNPAFDSINSKSTIELKNHLIKEYNLGNKLNILFILGNGEQLLRIDDEMLERIFELKKKYQFNLILRPHPNNTKPLPKGDVIISKKEENIHGWLHASNIIITIISTVALEASIIDKTVIQYLPNEIENRISFNELDIGQEAHTLEEFSSLLEKAISSVDLQKVTEFKKVAASETIARTIIEDLQNH